MPGEFELLVQELIAGRDQRDRERRKATTPIPPTLVKAFPATPRRVDPRATARDDLANAFAAFSAGHADALAVARAEVRLHQVDAATSRRL